MVRLVVFVLPPFLFVSRVLREERGLFLAEKLKTTHKGHTRLFGCIVLKRGAFVGTKMKSLILEVPTF